jgi:GTP-binding protein
MQDYCLKKINYTQATFLLSAAALYHLPPDEGAEVAFVGRSNAGKSSALNRITGTKGLARTSKTPGRTQLINLFQLDAQHRLVDLPGYGYAKVSLATKAKWQALVNRYLIARKSLKGLILVMDIRHPLKPMDLQLLDWAAASDLPVHILLTKADKLNKDPANRVLVKTRQAICDETARVSVQLFSSQNIIGIEDARKQLDEWLK